MSDVIQYKCPECGEYGASKSWDEETIKHYDEDELKWVLSISTNKEHCEFYCPYCKSLINGKDIKTDEEVDVIRILKVIVNKLPEDCSSCTLHEGEYCKIKGNVTGSEWVDLYSDFRDSQCPLEVE